MAISSRKMEVWEYFQKIAIAPVNESGEHLSDRKFITQIKTTFYTFPKSNNQCII